MAKKRFFGLLGIVVLMALGLGLLGYATYPPQVQDDYNGLAVEMKEYFDAMIARDKSGMLWYARPCYRDRDEHDLAYASRRIDELLAQPRPTDYRCKYHVLERGNLWGRYVTGYCAVLRERVWKKERYAIVAFDYDKLDKCAHKFQITPYK